MKKLNQILEQIEVNQKAIQAFGEWDVEVLKKVNYKLRLDWNYYSNRMEGGTLTKHETRSVMVGSVDVQGKPLQDVMEMHGHDRAVLDVLKLGKGEQRIAESRMKELHKTIMHEEDPIKMQWVGKWKTEPNEIINYKDEKIEFAAPSDVPEAIHKSLDRANASLDRYYRGSRELHPLEIAAQFHLDFVTIHPFYDGNGRMARILTNIILVACGYAPIIIKDNQKKSYYQLLADVQAYGGKADLFYAFIGERLIESQELILSALNGEAIDEPDDLDKKLAMLEKEILAEDETNEVKQTFNPQVFIDAYENWVSKLFGELLETTNKFNKFYKTTDHRMLLQMGDTGRYYEHEKSVSEYFDSIRNLHSNNYHHQTKEMVFQADFKGYVKGGVTPFDCRFNLKITFDEYSYQISTSEKGMEKSLLNEPYEKKLLHHVLTPAEQAQIVKDWGDDLFNHLEDNRKKLKP